VKPWRNGTAREGGRKRRNYGRVEFRLHGLDHFVGHRVYATTCSARRLALICGLNKELSKFPCTSRRRASGSSPSTVRNLYSGTLSGPFTPTFDSIGNVTCSSVGCRTLICSSFPLLLHPESRSTGRRQDYPFLFLLRVQGLQCPRTLLSCTPALAATFTNITTLPLYCAKSDFPWRRWSFILNSKRAGHFLSAAVQAATPRRAGRGHGDETSLNWHGRSPGVRTAKADDVAEVVDWTDAVGYSLLVDLSMCRRQKARTPLLFVLWGESCP